MGTYQEKPIIVTALQWDGTKENQKEIISTLQINHNNRAYNEDGTAQSWAIANISGKFMPVGQGDFIIKNAQGAFSVLDETAFNLVYVSQG